MLFLQTMCLLKAKTFDNLKVKMAGGAIGTKSWLCNNGHSIFY